MYTEAAWDRNSRCLRHFRHYMDKMTREYEIINSEAPTKIHKATKEETEYYMNISNKKQKQYFNPLCI